MAPGVHRATADVRLVDDDDLIQAIPGPDADTVPEADSRAAAVKLPALRGYGRVLTVLLGLLVAGATVVALSSEARQQVALSFVPQPEKFTELYFSADKPTQVSSGPDGESVRVFFTIANHEGQTNAMPYTVRLVDESGVPLAGAVGSVAVPHDEATEVTAAVQAPSSPPWLAVEVSLDGRTERIRLLRTLLEEKAN